jgi:hypothetical protein
MYVCRTLSYKGADFYIVEAPLEERMMVKQYDNDKLSAFELLLGLIMFSTNFSLLYDFTDFALSFFYHINVFFWSMSDFSERATSQPLSSSY